MVTVNITSEMVFEARRLSNQISKTKTLRQTENYTGLVSKNRYYCGFLGEQVFLKYLESIGSLVKYETRTDGKSDSGDFIFSSFVVDVKTACEHFHKRIMMPVAQANRRRYDYYVGVKINGDLGEIWGFCKFEDFKENSNGFGQESVPTLFKSLDSLRSIGELKV